MTAVIDVLVVDDHTIFRSGLQRLLLDESDMRVAGEASNGAEALELLRGRPFDVVLLDINMEGRNGLEVLASVRNLSSTLPVLMLSMYPEEQYALVAVRGGAN
ncbi:MAG TPA: response regulator transcription factor, partial [Albitalea sp.]|nr:response regulator transcription factor [Albitalea sp.]